MLDEITEKEIPKEPKNQNVQQQEQQVPQTPASVVRISTRLSIPPKRYSPSLYYLFLTDSGEPESYEEPMHVENKNKWEQGMKEEMDSLVNNHTSDLKFSPKMQYFTALSLIDLEFSLSHEGWQLKFFG